LFEQTVRIYRTATSCFQGDKFSRGGMEGRDSRAEGLVPGTGGRQWRSRRQPIGLRRVESELWREVAGGWRWWGGGSGERRGTWSECETCAVNAGRVGGRQQSSSIEGSTERVSQFGRCRATRRSAFGLVVVASRQWAVAMSLAVGRVVGGSGGG
jgi:hypothetical protein